jgi:hypothetical protein
MLTLRTFFIGALFLGNVFGGLFDAPSLDAIVEFKARIRSGDRSIITELENANTPTAVCLLAQMTYLYSGADAPDKYPGVWQATVKSLARMPGACAVLGEACRMEVRNFDAGEEREKYFEALRLVRSQEAVRTVGALLFDEYDIMLGDGKCVAPNLGSNADRARNTIVSWLVGFPEFEQRLTSYDTKAWQKWWNERKHDPATIRAIAENRRPPDLVPPLPPAPKLEATVPLGKPHSPAARTGSKSPSGYTFGVD